MSRTGVAVCRFALLALALAACAGPARQPATPLEPRRGQPGKDAVWVPTPQSLVDLMLDMAEVTPEDVVLDLGSGDGIVVISAAKRGAEAIGIEYNSDLVELARTNASTAGVTKLATFEQGDLFETDLSEATVVTMFLMPELNMKLRPRLLDLAPGTRIVSNTWDMGDWAPDDARTIPQPGRWQRALLWIVPAKAAGNWRMGREILSLTQQFQMLSGTLGSTPIAGRLRGNAIEFSAGAVRYVGRVDGNEMTGTYTADGRTLDWRATRQ